METLCLNLGSRDRIIPGYENMDIDPHPGVKHVGDVSSLEKFPDGSVTQLFASNILEHFSHKRTVDILKEWHRALKPGGILYLSVPDFERVVELYKRCGRVNDWIENFVCGDQDYATAYHYAIFDSKRLREVVLQAGFRECSYVESFGFADKNDCSNIVSSLDLKPVCLNAIVVK